MPEIVVGTAVSANIAAVWRVVRDVGGRPARTDSAPDEANAPDRIATGSRGLAEHVRRVGAAHPGGVR